MNPPAEPLRAGDPPAVGGYRLLGRLGEGGQGVVYLGEGRDGTRVAVKVLRGGLGGDDRFAKEIAAARRVEPFCIAQVLDASAAGRPYIVTEYVEGPSLHQAGRHSGADLQRLAVATATALAAVHAAGVVHRDFKPANVLLGPGGPRVIDFGIARAVGAVATATSGIVGTPAYMAPEQLAGQEAGPAADVFAWAGVIVFAATGTPPFGDDTLPAIINRILHNEPHLGDLPRQLRGVVYDCLAKDPGARPPMREVLLRLLGGDREAAGAEGTPAWERSPAAAPAPAATHSPGPFTDPAGRDRTVDRVRHGRGGRHADGDLGGAGGREAFGRPGGSGGSGAFAGPGRSGGSGAFAGRGRSGGPEAFAGPGASRRAGGPVRAGVVVPLAAAAAVVVTGGLVYGVTSFRPGLPDAGAGPAVAMSQGPTPVTPGRKPYAKRTPKPKPATPKPPRTTPSPARTPTPRRTTPAPVRTTPAAQRTTPEPTTSTTRPAAGGARIRILGIDLRGGPGQDHSASCYMPPVGFSGSMESSRSEVWISYAWVVDGVVKMRNRSWVPKGEFTAPALAHQYMLKTGGHSVTLKVTAPGSAAKTVPFSVCPMEEY
ncbi:serine/threonine-protein kinase [Nonomuraea typhae]|uniref:serine/threonine-protein kinase n=1 Tax=Nonomuraea typhae TaxID=2603600 RepID=UPI001C681C55|nr:serine/threonine-protein kinase [Nonomuraea typhae]